MSNEATLSTLFRLTLASGVPAAVAFHLKRGAPLNGRDGKGRTPLILAAMRGYVEVCRLLLEAGADVVLRDADDRDALVSAEFAGHAPVVALIASYQSAEAAMSASGQALAPGVDSPKLNQECPALTEPADGSHFFPKDNSSSPGSRPEADAVPAATLLKSDIEVARTDPAETTSDDIGAEFSDEWIAVDEGQTIVLSADELQAAEPVTNQTFVANLQTPAQLSSPAAGLPVADQWEPEPEPSLTMSVIGIERAAVTLNAQLTSHTASISDQDWADTDLALPEMAPRWLALFVEGFDGYRAVVRLLEAALRHGWVPEEALDELGVHAATLGKEEILTAALRAVLGDLGILIEGEHALDLSRDAHDDAEEDSLSFHRSDVANAVELLDGLAGALPDAEGLLLEEAARARIPSASEEVRLFRELALARRELLTLAASTASTPAILRSWADQLDAGLLLARDVSGADWTAAEEVDDVLSQSGEERSAAVLAARLREAAQSDMNTALIVSEVALITRRILELAEGALSHVRRLARRRGVAPEPVTENKSGDLHLLRRTSATGQPPRPAGTVREVLERYLVLRETIVKGNLRRVVWNARRYARPAVPFLDLVQEGQIGLLKAIDKYDVERGWRFGTYAAWWIRQSMSRYVQDTGHTVRIPVHLLERITRTRRHADAFRMKLGFEPSAFDLAREMELDVQVVERTLTAEREIMSVEDAAGLLAVENHDAGLTGGSSALEFVDLETPLTAVLHDDLRLALMNALQKLERRRARILDLRFGLTDGEPLTLEEVGQLYGVTRERIRQIEAKTLALLPRYLPSRRFEGMIP